MRAGRLDSTVHLQELTETRDAIGGITKSWSTTATVRAAVEQIAGNERFLNGQRYGEVTAKILIRYSTAWSDIDTSWRIENANTGRRWDIVGVVTPDRGGRRNRVIELMVKENENDDE